MCIHLINTFWHLFLELSHTQSVGFPLSPTSTSPSGHTPVPLSPRYSLNLSGGIQQQQQQQQSRPHTPSLQNAAMGSSTSSLQGVPVIRVNLPHGQHTKVCSTYILCYFFRPCFNCIFKNLMSFIFVILNVVHHHTAIQ